MAKREPGCCPAWKGKIKGCGYKVTAAREAILAALSGVKEHLSAEEIYRRVHENDPAVGLTTVYRTLELLARLNLVSRFDFGDGRARYELAADEGDNHHHHLICTGCNRVIDYADFIDREVKLLQETEKGLTKKYRFRITSHLIQFYGLCDRCVAGGDRHGGHERSAAGA